MSGAPVYQATLTCDALVYERKGVYRRCKRTPEFTATLDGNRGYVQRVCFTHLHARTITFAVDPY